MLQQLKWNAAKLKWNATLSIFYLFDGNLFFKVDRGLLWLYFIILNTTIFSFGVKCYHRVEMKCCRSLNEVLQRLKWSAAEFWSNASDIILYLFDGHQFLKVERGLLLLYFNISNTTIFSFGGWNATEVK